MSQNQEFYELSLSDLNESGSLASVIVAVDISNGKLVGKDRDGNIFHFKVGAGSDIIMYKG